LQFLLLTVAGWMTRDQRRLTDYLLAENRVLREQLRGHHIRVTPRQLEDSERIRVDGIELGRSTAPGTTHSARVCAPMSAAQSVVARVVERGDVVGVHVRAPYGKLLRRRQQTFARLFAVPARSGAGPTMFHRLRVTHTFCHAMLARDLAGFENGSDDGKLDFGLPGEDLPRRLTNVRAVLVETYAAREHLWLGLAHTSVRARNAGLFAVETSLDTAQQRRAVGDALPRVRLKHLLRARAEASIGHARVFCR
jgi:hypothetical protein